MCQIPSSKRLCVKVLSWISWILSPVQKNKTRNFFYKLCHQRQHTISCNVTNIGGTVDQKVWKRSVLELAKRLLEKLSVVSGCEKVFDKGYDIRERATSCDFYFDPSVYLEPADRREDKTLKLKEMILRRVQYSPSHLTWSGQKCCHWLVRL